MPSLNKVQLIGRLGQDPEKRSTPKGNTIASFSLAVDRHWKSAKGEIKKTTDWFRVEFWGKLAEVCLKYLKKGRLVYVEGRLKTDKWEEKGETRYFTKVIASGMQMLEKKGAAAEVETEEVEDAAED